MWQVRCASANGLVRPVRIDPAGVRGPTRGQARGPGWRSAGRGWFVPSDVVVTPEQRILEASVRLPPGGAVSGWAACRLWGAGYFDGHGRDGQSLLSVPLVVGPRGGTRAGPDIVVIHDRLDPSEVATVQGIACVSPHRAVFDAMRWAANVRDAVVAFDMAAAAGVVTRAGLERYLGLRPGWSGIPRVRSALDLGSERSRSPAETRLRLIWTLDAGLPKPLVNWPVADERGTFLAEVDLLDPVAGLVGEYDGAHHRSAARHARDVWREDRLRRVGLEYVAVTGRDLARPDQVVERIRAARGRAARLPPETRTFLIKAAAKPTAQQPN